MTAPLVSIIVPTRARPHLLPRAVSSVFTQTHQQFELIVVDDNPATARAQTLAALAPWSGDQRLRYVVNQAPRNSAAARNCGLDNACGEWITFLDDDDAYEPRKLERQLALATASDASIVLCGLRYHAGKRIRLRQCGSQAFTGDELLLRAQGATPAIFYRRNDLRFDPECDAAEDVEFFLRIVANARIDTVACVPLPLVEVYQQPSAARTNVLSLALLRGQRRCWMRHARRYSPTARRLLSARLWWMREISGMGWGRRIGAVQAVLHFGGTREIRFLLNLALRRMPLVSRWLSS